jgi:hypothetical protein
MHEWKESEIVKHMIGKTLEYRNRRKDVFGMQEFISPTTKKKERKITISCGISLV